MTITRSVFTGDASQCRLDNRTSVISDTFASSACGDATVVSAANINLGSLADNGGPTPTILPQADSVLIDAAAGCTGTDQRGFARPMNADGIAGDDCDIGAVEVINDQPIALGDRLSGDEDSATASNTDVDGGATLDPDDNGVLANDSDAIDDEDGGVLEVVALESLLIDDGMPTQTWTFASGAQFTLNQDGSFSFDGEGDYESLAAGAIESEVVDYTISDGFAATTAAIIIDITGANDDPVAGSANANVLEDQSITLTFPASDVDDGDSLSYAFNGTDSRFTNNGDGTYSFNAEQPEFQNLNDGNSTTASLGFTVTDSQNASDSTGSLEVTIQGINDAPIATDDSYAVDENTALNVAAAAGLLANDSDVDSLALTVVDGSAFNTDGVGGTLLVASDGSLTYTPPTDTSGADRFTYQISDGELQATAQLTITISNLDDAPTATDDALNPILEDAMTQAISVGTLLANDDAGAGDDTDSIAVISLSNPVGGTLALHDNGTADPSDDTIVFTPESDFFGTASIDYTIEDQAMTAATATVTIPVTGVNDAPSFASPIDLSFPIDAANVQVIDNFVGGIDFGPGEDSQTVQSITATELDDSNNAVDFVSIDDDGQLAVLLNDNFGTATIEITLSDNGGTANDGDDTSAPQTVTITRDGDILFVDGFEAPEISATNAQRLAAAEG